MDINIVVTRTTIFGLIYGAVFAVSGFVAYWARPYLNTLLGPAWWMAPAGIFVLLASFAPFTSITLTRRAEARILRNQRRYQQTLVRASQGMMRIRELDRLLGLIVHILTRVVRIHFAGVFLLDRATNTYAPQSFRGKKYPKNLTIDESDAMIKWLKKERRILVREEIQFQLTNAPQGQGEAHVVYHLKSIDSQLARINASLVVPSFIEDRLLGFLVMGDKRSGQVYSQDDLDVFTTLANQAALAIENALFYEELQLAQANLFQSEKLATIGQLAASIAHEIHNPLTIISGEAQLLLGRVNRKKIETLQREDLLKERQEGMRVFNTIISEVRRASDITRRVLKHSRPAKSTKKPISMNETIDEALALVGHQVVLEDISLTKNFTPDLPPILANFTQVQEVFINVLLHAINALHGKEGATFFISTYKKGDAVVASFRDNGVGLPADEVKKIFNPFSPMEGENGNLGLFVSARIVRGHGGDIDIESTPEGGSTFFVKFPIAIDVESLVV